MRNYSSVVQSSSPLVVASPRQPPSEVEPTTGTKEWCDETDEVVEAEEPSEFDEVSHLLSVADEFYSLPAAEQAQRLQEWQELYISERDTEVGEFVTFFAGLLAGGLTMDAHQSLQDLVDVSEVPFEIVKVIVNELVSDWWAGSAQLL